MPILLRIALRNLREHKAKTIIIAGLIAMGMLLLVLGNSLMETALVGIEKSFVKSYSGHILVGTPGEKGEDPSMFASGPPGADPILPIQKFDQVYSFLQQYPGVAVAEPQLSSMMRLELKTEPYIGRVAFLAFDNDTYNKMFPENFDIIAGRMLNGTEKGILLSEKVMAEFKDKGRSPYNVGETITLTAFAGGGIKNIELPIIGVFRYRAATSTLENLGFMDVSSMRSMKGFVVGAANKMNFDPKLIEKLDKSAQGNPDDFFSDDSIGVKTASTSAVDLSNFDKPLGDMTITRELNKPNEGDWDYVLLRLQNSDPAHLKETITKLNADLKAKGWNLRAVDWQTAAGFAAGIATATQMVFTILVIIICVVSIFIIMNTMISSIFERTAEIGTMRALGAQKGYVRQVFLIESLSISVLGGLIGLVIAIIILAIMNVAGLSISNAFFQFLLGGKELHPVLSLNATGASAILMLLVGVLSSLYPTALAMRVSPLKAMTS